MSIRAAVALGVPGAALVALPLITAGTSMRLLATLFAFAVMAQAWNLVGGFGRAPDLGSAAFFGLGAYVTAILSARAAVPAVASILAGGVLAAMLASVLGSILLRGRWDIFAIGTLSASFALRELATAWTALTGGTGGISLPPSAADSRLTYYALLALAAALPLASQRLRPAVGQGPTPSKLRLSRTLPLYSAAAALIGLVGGIEATSFTFIEPGTVFDLGITIELLAMVLLGGAGTITGPMLGACLLTAASELLDAYAPTAHATVLGLVILGALLLLPRGLVGLLRQTER